ncbi:MAG TPA: monovalent cation/H+ antiporter complex subunit F [Arenicellales bacterium]|jgi:multicomponent Na+:H+ antiporter subunit F|nr:monovalent cation/H+ antiporter complex subunit F [Pseudomonadota bacterium]MEC8888671.1 monovalent cation/H+ antiporter complex subunit F [Pseudomonadota bacterium]MED5391125.1 monovalent cation/H+ antiporter complex subunit F [Pseudomonadota bacterium]MEE3292787.1 monovalent cation/H+ antiporter complex subunit F [Pseudomonadota bacterium]HJM01931.1 monovalent cation/H+ antiporter complex subunit F [Arenicellales bacterium]|tara:strand:+ start:414 stop:704 length:291 start_codon:yes stop_codon:yes gene_type:complete
MLLLVTIALLVAMGLALIRAIKGPAVYDRILASNTFSTKTVLMISVLGFLTGESEVYLDIALMYALVGFVVTVAVLKVSEFGDLGQPRPDSGENRQ